MTFPFNYWLLLGSGTAQEIIHKYKHFWKNLTMNHEEGHSGHSYFLYRSTPCTFYLLCHHIFFWPLSGSVIDFLMQCGQNTSWRNMWGVIHVPKVSALEWPRDGYARFGWDHICDLHFAQAKYLGLAFFWTWGSSLRVLRPQNFHPITGCLPPFYVILPFSFTT